MIDTGGTMSEAVHALKRLGAEDIYCCATHALLSGPAVERLHGVSPVTEVAVTNTIAIPPERQFDKLKVLSIAGAPGQGDRLHPQRPVGQLAVRLTQVARTEPWHSKQSPRGGTSRTAPARAPPARLRRARQGPGRHLRPRPRSRGPGGRRGWRSTRLLAGINAGSTILDVAVDGRGPGQGADPRDPAATRSASTDILHLDLYEVRADEKITVEVPVHLVGTAGWRPQLRRRARPGAASRCEIQVFPADIPDTSRST